MLALSRLPGQAVLIGDSIKVIVTRIDRGKVRLAFDAPRDVPIWREELVREKPNGQEATEAR